MTLKDIVSLRSEYKDKAEYIMWLDEPHGDGTKPFLFMFKDSLIDNYILYSMEDQEDNVCRIIKMPTHLKSLKVSEKPSLKPTKVLAGVFVPKDVVDLVCKRYKVSVEIRFKNELDKFNSYF